MDYIYEKIVDVFIQGIYIDSIFQKSLRHSGSYSGVGSSDERVLSLPFFHFTNRTFKKWPL